MNYFVVCKGHISFFEQHEDAVAFALDFSGVTYNIWGLLEGRKLYGKGNWG